MNYSDEEICTHIGETVSENHGAVAPPIYQTSLFAFESFEAFTKAQEKERENYVYTRGVNPTAELLENKLAYLERGEKCKCFASGMGAISAVFLSLLKTSDHVLFVNNIYGPTTLLLDHLKRFYIDHSFVSGEINEIEKAIKPTTKLIYMESPGTMIMNVVDLEAIAAIGKAKGIVTAIDNTWSTPIFQKPLTMGIDLSIHSLTKYIGGHSDVVGGAVIGNNQLVDQIFQYGYQLNGAVLAPHDASLIIRGLRTLPLRMKQHEKQCRQVIEYLQGKEEIQTINHPSLLDERSVPFITKQMSGYSGLLSFELKEADFDSVALFINQLSIFKIGVSWGGFESLVTAPVKRGNEEMLRKQGVSPGLIRLSIGLEGAELLINDLERGFQALKNQLKVR
ncbi:trans-sulfuration enzyme family protein [Sediminibacillus albus]|uniref:homocysteine desulfhydrase n=1 Tax=Sediminibacillus albus TaxID=407036 RepID=A0A1G8WGQ7_9BACI|nr:PLP-dependent aspartate aminotransferase family protein [Sediminibacillus albus]SDJ77462.1 cystathionine beta-lyase [Sediminibacillus albus]